MRRALVALALVLVALGLRLHGAGRDLPPDVELTASPAQDAFWYLDAAQAPADGSRVEPLGSYDRPLWVALGRAWFAVAGTGIESAARLAAVLGALSVLGVFLALRGPRAAALGALLLATSYPFVALAKTPLIYGPIAALLALALALHARDELWARGAAWLVVVIVAAGFKEVALVAAPGLLLGDLVRARWRGRLVALVVGALLVAGTVWAIGRFDPDELERTRERLGRYCAHDLDWGAWRRVVLAPHASGLLALAPGLCGLAAIGATRWRRPVVLAALGWAGTAIFGLAFAEYRPLRFYALAGPPLAVLAGAGADALLAGGRVKARAPLVAALVTANACALFVHGWAAALAAPLGVGAALLVATLSLPRVPSRPLGALLLVLTLGLDVRRDLAQTPATLLDANRIVGEALAGGERAVLAGPYASSLAAGHRGLERTRAPELTGGAYAREGLAYAERAGLTHVALDAEQDARGQLSSGFAALGEKPILLLALPVRGATVLVYRLASAERRGYRLSPFERALAAPDPARALRDGGFAPDLVGAATSAKSLRSTAPR